MFVDINEVELLKFNNCKDCDKCCYKLFSPLILEDFERVYKYLPILFIKLDFLKPVMVISDGENPCRYLKGGKCEIYEDRPPACRIYPFSPWYDKILIDLSCDGVGIEGELLPLRDFKNSEFYDKRFENITQKVIDTRIWAESKEIKKVVNIKGFDLYLPVKIEDKYDEMMVRSYERLCIAGS